MSHDPRLLSDAAPCPDPVPVAHHAPAAPAEDYEREMIDSAIDFAIFTFFEDRKIASWSPGAERIFGYGEQEITGEVLDLLFTPEDREAGIPEKERIVAATEGRASDERWHLKKDGSRFYASGAVFPVKGSAPQRFVKIAMDRTRRKLMEEALTESDRRKNEFIATLAHELRNPLAPIRTGIELLARKDLPEEMREKVLTIMVGQMATMVHLVDDLLEVSRITQGKVKLKLERIDLVEVVRSAVASCQTAVGQSPQDVAISAPSSRVWIEGDAVRLEQCVVNLVTNAFKFTPPEGKIHISVSADESSVEIAVMDNGKGLKLMELTSVFELFTQVSDLRSGLGIGLAVVKSLAELHGGGVRADSQGPGLGSCFTIRLPRGNIQEPVQETIAAASPGPVEAGMRILVVDDNLDAAALLSTALTVHGFDVRKAHAGLSAVTAALEFQPVFCLCDIGLPEIDGHEVARRVLAHSPGIIFVAISGWGADSDRDLSRQAGFRHHFVKPVSMDELLPLLSGTRPELNH